MKDGTNARKLRVSKKPFSQIQKFCQILSRLMKCFWLTNCFGIVFIKMVVQANKSIAN